MVLTPSLETYNITNSYAIPISFTSKILKSDMSSIHVADFEFTKKHMCQILHLKTSPD